MLVYERCKESLKAEPKNEETIDNQALCARKTELLTVFFQRYDWRYQLS